MGTRGKGLFMNPANAIAERIEMFPFEEMERFDQTFLKVCGVKGQRPFPQTAVCGIFILKKIRRIGKIVQWTILP